jgi:hypothetical protein
MGKDHILKALKLSAASLCCPDWKMLKLGKVEKAPYLFTPDLGIGLATFIEWP